MGFYEAIKDTISLVQKADNIELLQKLMAVQVEAFRVVEENEQLREQVRELRQLKDLRERLQFRDDAYWLEAEGQAREGPFCSTCWDVEGRLVRKHTGLHGHVYCSYCTYHRARD